MKKMTLPFNYESAKQICADLVSFLTVQAQPGQPCAGCAKDAKRHEGEGWTLILDACRGDFAAIRAYLYCPECARARLAHFNRLKECEADFGNAPPGTQASRGADRCRDAKTEAEEEES